MSEGGRLAGARRWLEVAERALADDSADAAVSAARTGLDELGPDYAPADVEDDTTLKVFAADELIADGDAAGGARMLAGLLRERINLYAERHSDTIES